MSQHKDVFVAHIRLLQNRICEDLEIVDGKSKFSNDRWERPGGGGGESRVIQNGNVFEKGGVNISIVHGELAPAAALQLKTDGHSFFAAGLSLVLHPVNPFVPTVHANWRYFEILDQKGDVKEAWFGGGTDLTPYYLFEEDVIHFHTVQKKNCDAFDPHLYERLKNACDHYFSNHHRNNEGRGVGGIFFDHCRASAEHDLLYWQNFTLANGLVFLEGYLPIVEKRKHIPFSAAHKYWQEIRRGRYVEFNLLHDRGTLFGIRTNGRTESILMSLPPTVRFDYNYHPAKGSEEERLLRTLQQPRNWVHENAMSI